MDIHTFARSEIDRPSIDDLQPSFDLFEIVTAGELAGPCTCAVGMGEGE